MQETEKPAKSLICGFFVARASGALLGGGQVELGRS